MNHQKQNVWSEVDLEEDDFLDNVSDVQEIGRGPSLSKRSSKRKKVHDEESHSNLSSDSNNFAEEPVVHGKGSNLDAKAINVDASEKKDSGSKIDKRLQKARNVASRSGVIYISRIPPFMKPHTVKNLLGPHAKRGLGRIFLTPESQQVRQSRLRGGGNKKKSFADGWVEFVSKREAKAAVETLNTRTIGGKKGGYYVDDVWNLKYLKNFKWRHLTEQIANENAERAARMRAEGQSSRRTMNEFLRNVDHAKIHATRQQKREAKALKAGDKSIDQVQNNVHFNFRQNQPVQQRQFEEAYAPSDQAGHISRVLDTIF